ncbi:hypothetical protein BFP70_08475 [Thioclava sp. SK-1]|uniref:peptidylprolyl isomerase n=1 Tax=Thioclava sp. SK-1 TaxID=1889770 RepID=UPI00082522BF|nr:peptidylprolyl isomerase [Thioclava sp. SK-1]OCX66208.1 hypothetical protein BFP70_08475 [Thioclava sp. SK-1]
MKFAKGMVCATAALWMALSPAMVTAQSFAPVITVNGGGITGWELEQRVRMMTLLGQRGDLRTQAENDLIEDRLRSFAAARLGIKVNDAAVDDGMAEFASRANLTREQFLAELSKGGVDAGTFRAFVRAGLEWRAVMQQKFGGTVQISDIQINRALRPEAQRSAAVRVLMSEIIIPMQPGREDQAMAAATRASQTKGEGAFGALARQVSASASRDQGGRLDWLPISRLPSPLRAQVLALKPGQATQPISLPNAVAVFMLRALDEGAKGAEGPQTIDYARLILGPSGSPETDSFAASARANSDSCDDLFTVAKGLPADRLIRTTTPQSQLPGDIAVALATLDPDETAQLTRGANQELVMLCARTPVAPPATQGDDAPTEDALRNGAQNRLRQQQLEGLSQGYLDDLRAEAVITRR